MNLFYAKEKIKKDGYSLTQCLCMFGCSKSGYYAWKSRKADKDGKRAQRELEEKQIMEEFRMIIAKRGYIPGKRTFRTELWREFHRNVSVKRCARIMRKMSLVPNRPRKDAYKHQATHNHECTAPANMVNQQFYQGPRKIILTDITYLYYGKNRSLFYLCAFKDAYTKEILGHAMSTRMTVDLIKEAYSRMKEAHGKELNSTSGVFIHSDQGSQYLSSSFRQLLEDDEFIQSVSGRGNSQDNAPMESYFGRMKTALMDLLALCPDLETAMRIVNGYISRYNTEFYQYNLSGLTPQEFYQYVTTGIYPLDNYYGVESKELRSVTDLVNDRRKKADEKNEKDRKRYAEKNAVRNRLKKTPLQIIARDQRIIRIEKQKAQDHMNILEKHIFFLNSLYDRTRTAGKFISSLPKDIYEELRIPQNWQKYKELDYIYDMNGLF